MKCMSASHGGWHHDRRRRGVNTSDQHCDYPVGSGLSFHVGRRGEGSCLLFRTGWDDLGPDVGGLGLGDGAMGAFGTHGSIRDNGDIVSITYDT